MPSPSAMPAQPAWLPHYLTVAACLDAAPCPPVSDAPEMSEGVFQALVEGRLDDVEDQIEDLPDWGQRPCPATSLADDPLRAIALAGLCRALPNHEAIAALTGVGAVTVLDCPPGGMIDDAASLLAALLARGGARPPVRIIALRAAGDARAAGRPEDALVPAMAAISATTAPHVLLVEAGVALPSAIAATLLARGRVREIRVGMAGGHVALGDQAPLLTRRDLVDQLTCLLAGRAAEELVLGSGCIGAGQGADSDLAKATDIALRLELTYGLSGHSLVRFADPARMLMTDPAVRTRADRRLRTALRRARQLLAAEYHWLLHLADRLCAERIVTYGENGLDRPSPDPEACHEP